MLRFVIMILRSVWYMPFALIKCVYMDKHSEKYDELTKYRHVQYIFNRFRISARTKTLVYGQENLPESGPYIMMPNHQGKYDGLGIVIYHDKPTSVIMEKKKADMFVAKQMIPLVGGKKLDLENPRQQIEIIKETTKELKAGKIYLIFPEGGYENNGNEMREFHTGVFNCAFGSKCTIVPVALVDAYKSMNGNSLKKVTTQIHYLKPIKYEEYKDLKKNELAELVKERIQEKLDEIINKTL